MNAPPLVGSEQDRDALNRGAREQASSDLGDLHGDLTGIVSYSSAGRLLVVGEDRELVARAVGHWSPLRASVLLLDNGGRPVSGVTTWHSTAGAIELEGWLGAFRLRLPAQGAGVAVHDLVLDLGSRPLIPAELPPPGYVTADADSLNDAIATLRDLVGQFQKPRYFRYDPDTCAHGMKGMTACRRCIDACPAQAITSLVERVRVEPHLCQGGGACATVCPSGAMTYGYPGVESVLERVRRLLSGYLAAGGTDPVLLIHDSEGGAERVRTLIESGGAGTGDLLPLAVEEVASLGIEAWLAALAYGARAIRLVAPPALPAASRRSIDEQIAIAGAVLDGLGAAPGVVGWFDETDPGPLFPEIEPARHASVGDKRQIFYAALDHLYACCPRPHPLAALPAGAPFGTAAVNEKACTLCLACVTVCPGKALLDGQDVPQLRFLEANCLQCGLCTRACPEDAVWITPRLLFDAAARGRPRVLREDAPFHCVSCGKPFATTSAIGRIGQRLAGHSMFAEPASRRRLQMCGDCRVKDMMRGGEI